MAKRSTQTKNVRNLFYILTNGAQTETNYFELIKAKRSIYNVKIIYENGDPLRLVERASTLVQSANQVWCVFDIDNTNNENRLLPALRKAKEHGIKIAYSNLAFEVWLISHFQKCGKDLTTKQLNKILDDYLSMKTKKQTEYNKANKEILKKYFLPYYKLAIENARVVHEGFKKSSIKQNGFDPIWEWNSSTSVYKLIEALKLSK